MTEKQLSDARKSFRLGRCRWPFCVGVLLLEILMAAVIIAKDGFLFDSDIVNFILVFLGPAACILGGSCALLNHIFAAPSEVNWIRELLKFTGVFTLLFLILIVTALSLLSYPRWKSHLVSCSSNLKQIGFSLAAYAGDNGGFLPPGNGVAGLRVLEETGTLTDMSCYVCAASDTRPAKSGSALTEEHCDYLYYGGGTIDGEDRVVAEDKPGNHAKWRNQLFLSGRVERIRETRK